MRLIRGLHNLAETLPGCVATIGNFDGLHLGHQSILDKVKTLGREKDLPSVVITFEPQALEFFKPDCAPTRLTSLREKAMLLERFGIDHLVCLHFNASLARLAAADFVKHLLVGKLGIKALVIGDDFRFGKGRDGDRAMLEACGRQYGFTVTAVSAREIGTERISSTRVRQALADVDLATAARLLGRPYSNAGRVIHGDKRGRDMGVPTLNMDIKRLHAPLRGVFATRVHQLAAAPLPAISYIGTRPVFNGRKLLLESHIFDFDGDCYGRLIEVEYVALVREEMPFESVDALIRQMHLDMDQARTVLETTT